MLHFIWVYIQNVVRIIKCMYYSLLHDLLLHRARRPPVKLTLNSCSSDRSLTTFSVDPFGGVGATRTVDSRSLPFNGVKSSFISWHTWARCAVEVLGLVLGITWHASPRQWYPQRAVVDVGEENTSGVCGLMIVKTRLGRKSFYEGGRRWAERFQNESSRTVDRDCFCSFVSSFSSSSCDAR